MTLLPAETAPSRSSWPITERDANPSINPSRHAGEGGPYTRRRARPRARGSEAILATHRDGSDGLGPGPGAGERGELTAAEAFLKAAHLLLLEVGAGTAAVASLGGAGFALAHGGGAGDLAAGVAGFVVSAAIAAGTHTVRARRCSCPAHHH